MSTSGKNVALWLVFLVSLALPGISSAADQYCATRYVPNQQAECFKTLAQAEAYIRTEPSPAIGNAQLVRVSEKQNGEGQLLLQYNLPDTSASFIGDYYSASIQGHMRACSGNPPDPNGRGCEDEGQLQQEILNEYPYSGDPWGGTFFGSYVLTEPSGWGAWVASDRYAFVNRNPNRTGMRGFRATLATNGFTEESTVQRSDWFECPQFYVAQSPLQSEVPEWSKVCRSYARGQITVYRPAQCSKCPKDGNPLVAATGNKEYNEEDFSWEGQSFRRSYNSSNDLTLHSGLGNNWAHSYSDRLNMVSGEPESWRQSDGYYEILYRLDASNFVSRTSAATAVYREPDPLTYARWRVTTGPGQVRWFDESGRMKYSRSGDRVFSYEYCEASGVALGQCPVEGLLLKVRSPSGRSLSFAYTVTPTGGAEGSLPRITGISADGVAVAAFTYDSLGRLKYATHGADSREYLYAETTKLCRDAAGTVISGCDPQFFANYLTGVLDEYGTRYATYTYDDRGRATLSEHAGGTGRVTVVYQADGKSKVTLPEGATKTYSYLSHNTGKAPSHATLATTDGSIGHTTHADYSNDRLNWFINANGSRTTYVYTNWRQTSRKEGMDFWGTEVPTTRTIQTDWNAPWAAPTETRTYNVSNVLVAKSAWTYNSRGQVLTSTATDPATPTSTRTTATTYCEAADVTAGTCPLLGLVTSVNGPRTDVTDTTQLTYYANDEASCVTTPATCAYRKGDLWKVTNALGQIIETLRYDGAGRVLSIKEPNGVITDMEYHSRGWLTARKVRGPDNGTEADDAVTRLEYTPIGLVSKIIHPDGTYLAFAYDAAHRMTVVEDSVGNRITYTLDNAGRRIKEETKDSSGAILRDLSRIYNQIGQLQVGKDAYNHATSYTYDVGGNLDAVVDPQNTITDRSYDLLGRLVGVLKDSMGINAQTSYQYDPLNRLVKTTDPKGLDTQYQYNGLGDLTQVTSPDTGITGYAYDNAGNRVAQTDARYESAIYSYDALNRVIGITYADTALNVSYTYDTPQSVCQSGETFSTGRMTRMDDGSGNTRYCYDRRGNVVRKVQTTNGQVFTLVYGYTKADRLASITYPSGLRVDYTHNALGQPSGVTVTAPGQASQVLLISATYYPFGPAAELEYGDGRHLKRTYNQNYQPGVIEDVGPDGLSLGYEFDTVGNLIKLRKGDQSEPPLRAYAYDRLGRLTETRDGATNALLQSYTYDATGNRTSKTEGIATQAYIYPANSHRLSQVGAITRTYDAVGNAIAIGGTTQEFIYTAANRLGQVKQGGNLVMNYAYNGNGEQTRRFAVTGSTAQTYASYDEAGHTIGIYDYSGSRIQEIIWLGDLPVGVIDANKLYYVQADHLGTPRNVIDPVAEKSVWTWQLTGEVFGGDVPNQNPDGDSVNFSLDLRFPGQRQDSVSGLNYNYFRDYEPGTGRYIESDPIGLRGGVSTYSYVAGNPHIYVDPNGLKMVCKYIIKSSTEWFPDKGDVPFTYWVNSCVDIPEQWVFKCEENCRDRMNHCQLSADGLPAVTMAMCLLFRGHLGTICGGMTTLFAGSETARKGCDAGFRNCMAVCHAPCE